MSSVFNLVEEDIEGESYLTSGPLEKKKKSDTCIQPRFVSDWHRHDTESKLEVINGLIVPFYVLP